MTTSLRVFVLVLGLTETFRAVFGAAATADGSKDNVSVGNTVDVVGLDAADAALAAGSIDCEPYEEAYAAPLTEVPYLKLDTPLEEFLCVYAKPPGKPFVVEIDDDSKKELKRFDVDYLKSHYRNLTLSSDSGTLDGKDSHHISLLGYMKYMNRTMDRTSRGLIDPSNSKQKPRYGVRLMQDKDGQAFLADFWSSIHPPHFLRRANYIRALDPTCRGFLSTIFMGVPGVGAVNHQDYMGMGRWQLQVFGTKRWILHPATETSKMYNEAVDPFFPDYEKYPLYAEAQGRLDFNVLPGQIVFWPPGWWHSTQIQASEDFQGRNFAVNEKMVHSQNYDFFAKEARDQCGEGFVHPNKAGLTLLHCRCARDIINLVENSNAGLRSNKASLRLSSSEL